MAKNIRNRQNRAPVDSGYQPRNTSTQSSLQPPTFKRAKLDNSQVSSRAITPVGSSINGFDEEQSLGSSSGSESFVEASSNNNTPKEISAAPSVTSTEIATEK